MHAGGAGHRPAWVELHGFSAGLDQAAAGVGVPWPGPGAAPGSSEHPQPASRRKWDSRPKTSGSSVLPAMSLGRSLSQGGRGPSCRGASLLSPGGGAAGRDADLTRRLRADVCCVALCSTHTPAFDCFRFPGCFPDFVSLPLPVTSLVFVAVVTSMSAVDFKSDGRSGAWTGELVTPPFARAPGSVQLLTSVTLLNLSGLLVTALCSWRWRGLLHVHHVLNSAPCASGQIM